MAASLWSSIRDARARLQERIGISRLNRAVMARWPLVSPMLSCVMAIRMKRGWQNMRWVGRSSANDLKNILRSGLRPLPGLETAEIIRLAHLYAQTKPGLIKIADGLQRNFNGGQTVRAICALTGPDWPVWSSWGWSGLQRRRRTFPGIKRRLIIGMNAPLRRAR